MIEKRFIKKDKKTDKRKGPARKKVCKLCRDKVGKIDYKDIKMLERFTTERAKIISSRISGNCAKHQRSLSKAIKQARFLALLAYTR